MALKPEKSGAAIGRLLATAALRLRLVFFLRWFLFLAGFLVGDRDGLFLRTASLHQFLDVIAKRFLALAFFEGHLKEPFNWKGILIPRFIRGSRRENLRNLI